MIGLMGILNKGLRWILSIFLLIIDQTQIEYGSVGGLAPVRSLVIEYMVFRNQGVNY